VRQARRFADATLVEWATPNINAVLVASELATNALLYAFGPFTVSLSEQPGGIRLEVTDGHPLVRPIAAVPPSDRSSNGRGLLLVETFASDWGVVALPSGKTVWALLPHL
jgi:anti-sigma regulatory factor (Ser/Thr protein kinase)